MLDPIRPQCLDLTSLDTYLSSCQALAQKRLIGFSSLEEVAWAEDDLNCYPRLDRLSDPCNIFVANENSLDKNDIIYAIEALLSGRVFIEHACAGEATRLGLGPKYLINPRQDFIGSVWEYLCNENTNFNVRPLDLKSLSLGQRHMLQLAWDLWQLAKKMRLDPLHVLSKQTLLIIINQTSVKKVLADFYKANFYGFNHKQVLFIVQKAFPGLIMHANRWTVDPTSPLRLHNHGQMIMQTIMDNQLFRLNSQGTLLPLSLNDFIQILVSMDDKISFNIEDLDYLNQSIDIISLAVALKFGKQGIRMVMEVVANNPKTPIKGGICCFDSSLDRNVMIESFQLKGVAAHNIRFLNKNVNHYPYPLVALYTLRNKGLSMPLTVKDGRLYFQPVQGDLNFLLPTIFLSRNQAKPIRTWKTIKDTPLAMEFMARQDARPGFLAWAASLTGFKF